MIPTRRGHTRWLLLAPLAGLALILLGVWALEASNPQAPTDQFVVDDLPALAMPDSPQCMRLADTQELDRIVEDIRSDIPAGGRIAADQVTACPIAFDGLEVTYIGEVVGEILPREGGAWAQVNDDPYALEFGPVQGHREHAGFNTGLSVWLPGDTADQIEHLGRPYMRGDVIEVAGTVHRADPDDGGGLTVRASDVSVIAEGVEVDPPFHLMQAIVAAGLAIAAIAAVTLAWRKRQQ